MTSTMLASISYPVAHPDMIQRVECHPAPDTAMIGHGTMETLAGVSFALHFYNT